VTVVDAVERDAALLADGRVAVQVDTIHDNVVRYLRRGGLRSRSVAERHEIAAAAPLNLE
jgi:hypothetical protein